MKKALQLALVLPLILVSLMIPMQTLSSSSPAQGGELHVPQSQTAQRSEPGVWTKYSDNPVLSPSQSWEGGVIWAPYVIKDSPTFKMWYAGSWPSRIGYATSSDGITWTKLVTNPVLASGNPGDWDEEAVVQPYVLKSEGGYKMWFVGAMSGWTNRRIGYATSSDGVAWTKYDGNPVLDLGPPGSWEETEVAGPWVLYDNGTYKMWYTGQDSAGRYAIGYATSSDGITWTRYTSNPVLSGDAGTWDENGVLGSSVLFDGTVYRMWYFGKDSSGIDRIGYATSPDGINWTKYSGSPVLNLGNSGTWDDYKVAWPRVILDGGVYKMWYSGEDGEGGFNFGYATASAQAQPAGVGLVTDGPTVDDKSFNWFSYQGLLRAESELGVAGTVYTSTSSAEYASNLQQCVDDGNGLCISVGFLTADAILSAAAASPGTAFATVDFAWDNYPENLRGMVFAEDEAGYLAGSLAGLMTQSNVVGDIGGMQIPLVERFVEGYRNGAQCANSDVTVLVNYAGTFGDPDVGALLAQDMIAQGADVIFAPAGPTGVGAVLSATQSGVWGIGVDTDFYISVFDNGAVTGSDKLLSSAVKRLNNAVFDTIADVVSGTFASGTVRYDLAVDGVGLAPFHEADPYVPHNVRAALERVRQSIISGTTDVNDSCRTYIYLPFVGRNVAIHMR